MKTITTEHAAGPFRRKGFSIENAQGRKLATLIANTRTPVEVIEATGDLLASSWSLRELLKHVLMCSGDSLTCEDCKEAELLVGRESERR